MLIVSETFDSIQGEGFYSGNRSFFVRLAGCDIGCHWCDEKKSWPNDNFPRFEINQLVKLCTESSSEIVVVTGGEPLMQDLTEFTKSLNGLKKRHLETSGAYPLSGNWDWITLSPKKNKLPLKEIYNNANELKVVIYNESDFNFALKEKEKVNKDCLLYLQPEWSKKDKNLEKILSFNKKYPEWKLSVQTHKYLGLK
ncbi:MAG: 7-carboxy-7-deazaguanine synthase QueE [Flavobacteriales bacterium]|nr:7-carboxy-7-deazaguanine synthase QueE [Flavobacteriales bacterium]|tara:strand:- start:470 stop:1060 length:591 start_codon:yes stop_codon:yes gene_type:complete